MYAGDVGLDVRVDASAVRDAHVDRAVEVGVVASQAVQLTDTRTAVQVIDVKGFYVFLFWSRFYVFNVFFIFQTFFV